MLLSASLQTWHRDRGLYRPLARTCAATAAGCLGVGAARPAPLGLVLVLALILLLGVPWGLAVAHRLINDTDSPVSDPDDAPRRRTPTTSVTRHVRCGRSKTTYENAASSWRTASSSSSRRSTAMFFRTCRSDAVPGISRTFFGEPGQPGQRDLGRRGVVPAGKPGHGRIV